MSRDIFGAAATYHALYGDDEDVLDGGVPATFQIIYDRRRRIHHNRSNPRGSVS